MDRKGQALIEFVLILPVILLVLISLIDIGTIFMEKYKLSDDLSVITEMYQNGQVKEAKAYASSVDVLVDEVAKNDMVELNASKKVAVSAPGLKNVLGKNFNIKATQAVYVGGETNGQ